MRTNIRWEFGLLRLVVLAGVLLMNIFSTKPSVTAAVGSTAFADIQTVYTHKFDVSFPAGFAFLPGASGFLIWEEQSELEQASLILNYKSHGGTVNLPSAVEGTMNAAYDSYSSNLYFLNQQADQLTMVGLNQKGYPGSAAGAASRVSSREYGVLQPAGLTFDPLTGRMFILDAQGGRVVSVTPTIDTGFDGASAWQEERIERIALKGIDRRGLRGIAYNPQNSHLYVASPGEKTVYEFTLKGEVVGSMDLSNFQMTNIQSLTFAPSADQTDDPEVQHLFVLDGGVDSTDETAQRSGQILELTLNPMALPPGTTLLPGTLIRTIDTSSAAWNPSSPDPSGIDYFPPTGRLIIDDSEVEEMSVYAGANVFQATLSGTLTSTCNTLSFSREPTGIAVNPVNNHIFMTDDDRKEIYEINLGLDGSYCTADDSVTKVSTVTLFGGSGSDPEDVAVGGNILFMAGGSDAEVYWFSLGPNGVLGGGDDGPVHHFDTLALGFKDLEGIGYNHDAGTLFIVSTSSSDLYLGEVTIDGTLLRAYDLSFMGSQQNIRSDVGFLPSLANPALKNIYIASRGVDNDSGPGANPGENDGKIWEISIGNPILTTPTAILTATDTPTNTSTPTPTVTPTETSTPTSGPSPTPTNTTVPTLTATPTATLPLSNDAIYISLEGGGTIDGVAADDIDILYFDGTSWSLFFDASGVGISSAGQDMNDFAILDGSSILMTFKKTVTLDNDTVEARDIVRFDATLLGSDTAGSFSLFFDGSDVGLDSNGEVIDALDVLPDGRILISTIASTSVPGVSAQDEDILAFTPLTLGENTSGSWSLYFDGSNVDLATNNGEDVDSLAVDTAGNIYLSTLGDFAVTGVSGANEDVFVCSPIDLGAATACNFSAALFFVGSNWGLAANDVDGIHIGVNSSMPTPTPTATPTQTTQPTDSPTATATPTATVTPTPGPTLTNTPEPTFTPTDPGTATPDFTPTATPEPTFTPTDTATSTPIPTQESPSGEVYISLDGSGIVGGVAADDIDILDFDGVNWSPFFDASDVGISSSGQDMNDFAILEDSSILMTFRTAFILGDLAVDPWDIIQFTPTSLGSDTAGTFSLYFDGEDVGLDSTGETIDALDLLPDGRLLISVTYAASVPGLSAQDEDIVAFTPVTLGENTSGDWSLYFDGTAVGLGDTTAEDVDGLAVSANGGIFLSTLGDFSVTGIAGLNEDIFSCTPVSLGDTTDCSFASFLYFDGSFWGLDANDVDGIHIP